MAELPPSEPGLWTVRLFKPVVWITAPMRSSIAGPWGLSFARALGVILGRMSTLRVGMRSIYGGTLAAGAMDLGDFSAPCRR